jgi:hypothetical protein
VILLGLVYSVSGYAGTTYIKHIIKNETPFEFYYIVSPTTEIPTHFSCNCSGMIAPGEQQICECYSQLEAEERRYRMEYMKNTSPTYRLSASHNAFSDVAVTWTLLFDSHWEWLSVKATNKKIL